MNRETRSNLNAMTQEELDNISDLINRYLESTNFQKEQIHSLIKQSRQENNNCKIDLIIK